MPYPTLLNPDDDAFFDGQVPRVIRISPSRDIEQQLWRLLRSRSPQPDPERQGTARTLVRRACGQH